MRYISFPYLAPHHAVNALHNIGRHPLSEISYLIYYTSDGANQGNAADPTGGTVNEGAAFNRISLAAQVEQALREEIVSNRLAPNQRIDVGHYAALWQISPTPVRDAIKSLESAGFVTVSPRRGVHVADLNIATLREIYELRMSIECTAIRLASSNVPKDRAAHALAQYRRAAETNGTAREALLSEIDTIVHELALEYCSNTRLRRMMQDLNDLVRWCRLSVIRNLPQAYDSTLPEHIRLCEALVARDGEAASREMFRHLSNSLDRICQFLDKSGPLAPIQEQQGRLP